MPGYEILSDLGALGNAPLTDFPGFTDLVMPMTSTTDYALPTQCPTVNTLFLFPFSFFFCVHFLTPLLLLFLTLPHYSHP